MAEGVEVTSLREAFAKADSVALTGDDANRCQKIRLDEVYDELEDISYLKWYDHVRHGGINFYDTTLDLDVTSYFKAAVARTNNRVTITLVEVLGFKRKHSGVDKRELCNGHDLLERIYARAKAASPANFAKKPFFKRLRKAYPREKFSHTSLFKSITVWEKANGHSILAIA